MFLMQKYWALAVEQGTDGMLYIQSSLHTYYTLHVTSRSWNSQQKLAKNGVFMILLWLDLDISD